MGTLAAFTRKDKTDLQNKLFESALELTRHRDYVALTRNFIQLLENFPSIHTAQVFEVHGRNNVETGMIIVDDKPRDKKLVLKEVTHILNKPFPLDEFLEQYPISSDQSRELSLRIEEGLIQSTFSIYNESTLERILVLRSQPLEGRDWETILFMLRIYSNMLSVIDEKDRDRLTGLLNRYTFDNQVSHIVEYSQKQTLIDRGECKKTSWLAILDIDHFKQVNDRFGHLMGDEVLLQFVRIMEQSFRYTDILFRYGGEEFVVILNGCSREGAEAALERFRQSVESSLFPNVGQITVSIGYIQLYANNPPAILIGEADKALYHAKNTGRNRIVSYLELLENTDQQGLATITEQTALSTYQGH